MDEKAYIVHNKGLQLILDTLSKEMPEHIEQLEIAFELEADE